MALKRHLGTALLLASVLTGACRNVSVCSGPNCVEPPQHEAGGMPAGGARATTGEAGTHESGAAGAEEPRPETGGQAGAPGAGGEASTRETTPLVCDGGWGDCDGSTLTDCESNLQLSVRHCGACGSPCAGLCLGGKCKEGEQLFFDGSPNSTVATQGTLFTVMANFLGNRSSLYMFDLSSGKSTELFGVSGDNPTLSLGNDRVYLKEGAGVQAISFDGERVTPVMGPDGPLSAWYFAATSSGLYYVSADDESSVWTLSYRANQATGWTVIYEGGELELMSAGPQAIALLSGNWDSESRELMLATEGELRSLGTVRENWTDLSVYEDQIAVLSGAGDLSWYRAADEPPVQQTIPSDEYFFQTLLLASDGLVIASKIGHENSVQCYTPGGTAWAPLGISRDATPVFVNRTHLWYLLTPSWIEPSLLMRARLFEHDDL